MILGGGDPMNFHVMLFNIIAPVYSLFYKFQLRKYRELVSTLEHEDYLDEIHEIMDFGFGTGALLKAFAEKGYKMYGVDASAMMHRVAKRKLKNENVSLYHENILKGCMQCPEDAYDMTISSYVIHGLKESDRSLFYDEIKRITKKRVVFYEHSDNPSLGVTIAEFFEGGRYFSFIKTAKKELERHFKEVKTLELSKRVTVFIADPNTK